MAKLLSSVNEVFPSLEWPQAWIVPEYFITLGANFHILYSVKLLLPNEGTTEIAPLLNQTYALLYLARSSEINKAWNA